MTGMAHWTRFSRQAAAGLVLALAAAPAHAGLLGLIVHCHLNPQDSAGQQVHEVVRPRSTGPATSVLRVPLNLTVRLDGLPDVEPFQPANVLIGVLSPQGTVRYWAQPTPSASGAVPAAPLVADPTSLGKGVLLGSIDRPLRAENLLPPNAPPLELVLGPGDSAGLYRLFCIVAGPRPLEQSFNPWDWWAASARWLLVRDAP